MRFAIKSTFFAFAFLGINIFLVSSNYYQVEQCMAKIVDIIQPCSQRAINNWNLNHSMFVPSKFSTCCANWEVFDCFIRASLEYCTLAEFKAVAENMTNDALALQKSNCSRFRYKTEICSSYNGSWTRTPNPTTIIILNTIALLVAFITYHH